MATKKVKVETGEGLPDENTKGEFYKDLETDTLYQKVDGVWVTKPIFPSVASPVYA